ncbi:MAG: VWA domain-containing protein [Clostridia bacterium]
MENFRNFLTVNRRKIVGLLLLTAGILIVVMIIPFFSNSATITLQGEDALLSATEPTKLIYGAIAKDKKGKELEITWSVNGGNLSSEKGKQTEWNLPQKEGTYTISAKANGKELSKKVTVIGNVLSTSFNSKENKIENNDIDFDGLTNEYEQQKSLTDPNKADTDQDGLFDGDEIELGLNPLAADSKGDTKRDGERDLEYKIVENNATVQINGKGNVVKTTIDVFETKSLQENKLVATDIYTIHSLCKLNNAKISIKYNKDKIKEKEISQENLSAYKLLNEEGKFEKINSSVDIQNQCVNFETNELGKFFLADSSKINTALQTQVMFVIDNSGSMYSADEVENSLANDVEFKRVDLSTKLIDKLKGNYKFGAAKFTFEYSVLQKMTDDRSLVKEKINNIKTGVEKFTGTYISAAIEGGLKEFENNSNANNKILILLTDGKETKDIEGYDEKKIKSAISEAKQKNVKIISIGLGKEVDKEFLSKIATDTSGEFYYAPKAESLEGIFDRISADLNYNLVDTDKDGKDESVLVKSSNFITKINGFAFENFVDSKETNGKTYGMSLFAKLYYEKNIPTKLSNITLKNQETQETQKAEGYDIGSLVKEKDEKPLFEYQFKTLNFLSDTPKNYRGPVSNGMLTINPEYKAILKASGFSTYAQKYELDKAGFTQYENIILHIDSEPFKSLDKNDSEIIKAIYRLDILKNKQELISFSSQPSQVIDVLTKSFNDSKVVMIKINDNYYVDAISMSISNTDPNVQQIEVYDPNCKGENKYITVQRTKLVNAEEKNKYSYTFKYLDVPVNVSITIPNISLNL